MLKFWVFVILLTTSSVIRAQDDFEEISATMSNNPQFLESTDLQEDIDLLLAANEEQVDLSKEFGRSFRPDIETDSVKLIDVNLPEERKETPRRKQSNPIFLQPTSTEKCMPKLDLLFLLDSSGSIRRLYQEHVKWAVALVESLPIEPDTVRVAAVQYAGFPLTEFALGTYPSVEDIRKHLKNINFYSGFSRTGYALRKAEAELFRPDRGAREDAVKVVVVFTDGTSIDDPLKPAQQLRNVKGVKIYVVSLKPDDSQINKIAGSNENIFGPDDLKRLRDTLIVEAEKTRACIRIGNNFRPFKSHLPSTNTPPPLTSKWLNGRQSPFKNDLNDIIELSRAAAAISAARPGMLDENLLKMQARTSTVSQFQQRIRNTGTTQPIQQSSTTARTIVTFARSRSPTTPRPLETTTFVPFLGVRVIEDMDQDVFESDSSSRINSFRQRPAAQVPPVTASYPSPTKKVFKLLAEKLSSGRQEFTTTTIKSTRNSIPIVQHAIPVFTVENETTRVPIWRQTPTTVKVPLTVTATSRPRTTSIQANATKLIIDYTPRLSYAFPTLRPVQTTETTERPPALVTRPRISKVNAFPGVTCPHDILFIVDSSGSLEKVYGSQKLYLRDILSKIQVGNETHRVALLQFAGSRIQKTEWTYNSYADSPTLMQAVEHIRYLTGTTFIGAALNSARQILEQRRKGIPSLVILLSDGYSQDDATRAAEQIRRLQNLEFYALSVSHLSNMSYLSRLVGSNQNVFSGDETEDLKHLILNRLHCRF